MISRLGFFMGLVIGVCVSAAAVTADDAPTKSVGERIFAFLDSNGDKSIDTKEFGGFSSSMQSWLIAHGFDGTKPISQRAFVVISGEMMSDLRRARSRVGVPEPTPSRPSTTVVATPAKVTPAAVDKIPLTIEQTIAPGTAELPVEYQAGDLDRDGQIDFFEWRQFKRTETARFYQLDANKDYVLSLAELGGGLPAVGTTAPATTDGAAPAVEAPATADAAPEESTPEPLSNAEHFAKVMDKNENQKIDPEEWGISKRIGPGFVKAGIDIKKPMSKTDFVAHYDKVFPDEAKDKKDKKDKKDESGKSDKKDKKDKSDKRERKDARRAFRGN